METVIREGALKLLANESTCDVILSCQGRRLMAHKLILSIVSPVFRNLLLEGSADPAVIILPDIPNHTMSLILDYIYTGAATVYSDTVQQFLSLAKLFKIQLDIEPLKHPPFNQKTEENIDTKTEDDKNIFFSKEKMKEEYFNKKKKLPDLISIHKMKSIERSKKRRKMNSCLLPSPWRPRVETVLGDPREDSEYLLPANIHYSKSLEHDSNNNFQLPIVPRCYSTGLYRTISDSCPSENNNFKTQLHLDINESSDNVSLNARIPWFPERSTEDKDHSEKTPTDTQKWLTLNPALQVDSYRYHDDTDKSLENADVPELAHSSNFKLQKNRELPENFDKSANNAESNYVVNQKSSCVNPVETNSDKQKPFKCEECKKCFSQLRNFKYHRSLHEGTKEFAAKCSECGKVFNDKGYLSSHMKIHRDKKEYACPHCPKRFNQRVAYNMHTRIHTGVKPHECPTCGKSFSRKMLLKQHQRVHTGERPYSCPECGKTFADRSNMSLHARLHTGVKPYACNVCPKSFTKKHHLKTHMNFHTGLKPYNCQKCGLAFSQSSNMRTHYKKCLLKSQNAESDRNNQRNDEEDKSVS
ncbi:zinc finger protein 782-like [Diabrotica virgifera virgifera]|uniref:Zinc finger protein 782-like n=1 Tax=Diabrotica virgifera virgifera TaxID=50390 RepID=A0A6P7G1P4_DIAVI|nr:zinc finger protein 782-like [Diabrotica virgifera virgifera]